MDGFQMKEDVMFVTDVFIIWLVTADEIIDYHVMILSILMALT